MYQYYFHILYQIIISNKHIELFIAIGVEKNNEEYHWFSNEPIVELVSTSTGSMCVKDKNFYSIFFFFLNFSTSFRYLYLLFLNKIGFVVEKWFQINKKIGL
jgi:hypothetical protein